MYILFLIFTESRREIILYEKVLVLLKISVFFTMFPRPCIRLKAKYILVAIISMFLIDYFGLLTHMFELDYNRLFYYPMDGDVLRYAHQVRFNQDIEVYPINQYNYTLIRTCSHKCVEEGTPVTPKLTFIVKTAIENFHHRLSIRKTWGYEKRFSDVIIRTVFIVGTSDNKELEKHVTIESDQYRDIVQANFTDTYFNNTIKTMIGFRWAVEFCPRSKFYMFVDDDFYVSSKNVLLFVHNPLKYPEYLEEADETLRKLSRRLNESQLKNVSVNLGLEKTEQQFLNTNFGTIDTKKLNIEKLVNNGPMGNRYNTWRRSKRQISADDKLFAGYVFRSSPHRHKSSKWYIALKEYPFNKWPPYLTAGSFILSREVLFEMYFTSMYTKHFRFDDIYLGIVALKANIKPMHCAEFYFHKASYSGPHSYRYVIASHGYNDFDEMMRVWMECKSGGHA